jgi:alkylated DNA repair dioxygenase AlkB
VGDAAYRYSGIANQPQPWPAVLADIRDRLVRELGVEFNSCLANLYRDGSDSMGFHSDDEPGLGDRPTIASVSLGAPRRFVLRRRRTRARWTWELGHGDLLVMRDESQSDYAHAVPKTSHPIGPRMNLTFRQFQADS